MQISPLIYDEKGHRVASEDDVLDPKHIKVSADKANVLTNDDGLLVKAEDLVSVEEGNLLSVGADGKLKAAASDASTFVSAERDNTLTTGADGKLYVPPVELNVDVLSKEEGNMIRYGEDQGVFLDGNDVLSNGEKNLLKISNIDGLIELTEETLKAAGFIPGENAVAGVKPNDPLLSLGSDGLLSTAFDVEYDEVTGLTKFKGTDGRIAATVTLPVAVKTIKSVTLETDPIGMGKGQFIHFVFDTTGDEERDIYLDVTRLFNVYKAGQGIDISSDGTISTVISDIVALEPDNVIQEKDGKLYVSPISVYGELVSVDEGNVIVKGTDQRVYLGKEQLNKAVNDSIKDGSVPLVSKDGDNVITEGSDKGAMLSKSDLAVAVQEQVMAGSVKVVSTDDQNLIKEGTDKGAFLNQEGFAGVFTAAREDGSLKVVSEQADNVIVEGSDKGAYLDKAGLGTAIKEGALSGDIALASSDGDNLLQKGADGGVTLNEERLASAVGGIITAGEVTVVSTDANNVITEGVDHGAYLNKEGFKVAVKEAITSKASGVVSGNAGNVITEGTDGGANLSKQALATAITEQIKGGAVTVVSTDAGNIVKEGKDKGAFLGASDLGTAVASGLTDGSIDLISGDAKNAAKLGSDKKVFVEDKYLPLAGGTMTGNLTLKANPTANLQAATKQYVDTQDAKYLPLAGGTMTGNITVKNNTAGTIYTKQDTGLVSGTAPDAARYIEMRYLDSASKEIGVCQIIANTDGSNASKCLVRNPGDATLSAEISVYYPATGTPYGAAPNPAASSNTNHIATTSWVTTHVAGKKFLPLAGGTMTGMLTLKGNPTANLQAATKQYVDTTVSTATANGAFPSGTKMLFHQAAAPTGWTKVTTINDAALRVVSGTTGGSTSGSTAFSTLFAGGQAVTLSGNVGATTLNTSQMPAHTHSGILLVKSESGTAVFQGTESSPNREGTMGSAGGGKSHTHTLSGTATISLAVKYTDVIICTKA